MATHFTNNVPLYFNYIYFDITTSNEDFLHFVRLGQRFRSRAHAHGYFVLFKDGILLPKDVNVTTDV